MAEFKALVITNKGRALIAKTLAEQEKIRFTKISLSDEVYSDEDILNLAALNGVKQTAGISKVKRVSEMALQVEGSVNNTDLTDGYYIKTIALYAQDPDEGEIIYAACGAKAPGWMPAFNGVSTTGVFLRLVTMVANAPNVSVTIDPSAVATIGDVEDLQSQINEANNQINEQNTEIEVIDGKVEVVDGKVEVVDGKVEVVDGKVDVVDVKVETIKADFFKWAGSHNATYRGKPLGSTFTEAQMNTIKNGTFEDMYIGDYWIIDNINWRIAAFNYYGGKGNPATTKPHIVLVPDKTLGNMAMKDTATTSGGYANTPWAWSGSVINYLPDEIKNNGGRTYEYLINSAIGGKPSGGIWVAIYFFAMTSQNIFGSGIYNPVSNGSSAPHNYSVDTSQYPLFMFRPDLIGIGESYWLRDVATDKAFVGVSGYGAVTPLLSDGTHGIRPAVVVGDSRLYD